MYFGSSASKTHVYKYCGCENAKITRVEALDQKKNGNGGEARIIDGGPNHRCVQLGFTNTVGNVIRFLVKIYVLGREGNVGYKSDCDAYSTLSSSSSSDSDAGSSRKRPRRKLTKRK